MLRPSERPVVLIAGGRAPLVASALEENRYAVVQVPTGVRALEWARQIHPDAILLQDDLPDMAGIDACRLLHSDRHIGHNVPILILAPGKPTPDQRVTALGAGAWDFLRYPGDHEELSLKLQAFVQAKRNVDIALAEGLVDPAMGVHSRPGLARRARELGALMNRKHGGLACLVFALETDPQDARVARLLAHTARVSDVVGVLGSAEFAVLAPETNHAGAVKFALRAGDALRRTTDDEALLAAASTLRVGYDVVVNLRYSPMDPVALLVRASAAVRHGSPEPGYPWVRRFDVTPASNPEGGVGVAPRPVQTRG